MLTGSRKSALNARYRFEGHAIVSAEGMIADAAGNMPDSLCHPIDQIRFQAALDRAALIVLGRRSHEAAPNRRQRPRMVMTRSVTGLERGDDAWWWNPEGVTLEEALEAVAPEGGTIAIPGGRGAFDYFLGIGFDAFHLTRNAAVTLPGGLPLFSACREGVVAEDVLAGAGLAPRERKRFDDNASLTIWRRQEDLA